MTIGVQGSRSSQEPSEISTPSIIVGIPAFNTERNIAKIVVNTKQYCNKIIVCDDGSSDDTARIAQSLGCQVVKHSRNMGYGAALRTLIDTANAAGADILVTVDGDGQHNPQEISSMIAPILNGEADVVIGARFAHDGDGELPRFRKTGIKSITWLVDELTNQRISDAQSGFRAYGKRALSTIRPAEQGMGASTEILLKAKDKGLKVVEVPATITYKGGETSTLNPIYHFADVVSSTIKVASIRHPLLTYGVPGLVFLFLSLVFGARATQVLSTQGQFDIGVALISIGAAVIGTILAITALMLFVLVSVIREASK